MLGRDRDTTGGRPTGHSADSFAAFFVRKVDDVRAGHSKTLEQPANLSSPAWSKPWSISKSTQDAFVSGCMTAALSDYLLFSAVI